MKVFAIQKTQIILTPFKQNTPYNQTPIMKTNLSGDKFVSKVAFGASINEMEAELRKLQIQLEKEIASTDAYEALSKRISRLKFKIALESDEGGGSTSPADLAIKHYIP